MDEDDDIIQEIKDNTVEKDRVVAGLYASLGDDNRVYTDSKALIEKVLTESQRRIDEIVSMRHTIESQHRTIRELTRSVEDAAVIIGDQERTLDEGQRVVDEQNQKIEAMGKEIERLKKVTADAGSKGKGKANAN